MRRGFDAHGEYEKLVVTYWDVGYADNAGAITCHLIGDERFFRFSSDAAFRCVKSSSKSAYFWCAYFRGPTAVSRLKPSPFKPGHGTNFTNTPVCRIGCYHAWP